MPGKKVKALTIDAIPEPQAIGPVPNIVIHTGINDVNSNNQRPNRIHVSNLERKCKAVHAVYPKTHIFVSLLLPTKVDYLNRRVREFKDFLLEMTYRSNNKVKIIYLQIAMVVLMRNLVDFSKKLMNLIYQMYCMLGEKGSVF